MAVKQVIPCPKCGREKYYEGLCWVCQAEEERQNIVNMSKEQEEKEINSLLNIIACTGEMEDEQEELFSKLVCYRDINTSAFADLAYEKGIYFPCGLYKDASEQVVKNLCALLCQDDLDSFIANQILLCVSVAAARKEIRPIVYDCFVKLHKEPRAWRAKLHVNPDEYAVYGGWTYDKDFNIVETQYPVCYSLVQGTKEQHEHSPVTIAQATNQEERCPVCQAKMFDVIKIDGRDPKLKFLNIDGVIAIKCCLSCFFYNEDYFVSYDLEGNSKVLNDLQRDEEAECFISDQDYECITQNTYVLGEHPTPIRYHAQWNDWGSIGGFAFWIQDVEIKHCPKCGKPMKYLAQIPWTNVLNNAEGYGYIEICPDCQIAAVIHQQT